MFYNWYYKNHGIKFSGAVSSCGIIEDAYGPVCGVYHDLRSFYESGLGRRMDRLPDHPHGGRYVIYGDSAYRVNRTRRYISTGVSIRVQALGAEIRYCHEMNRTRVTIEWMFGIVYSLWELLRRRTAIMLGQSSGGKWYACAVILTNVRTCVRGGNSVSRFFDCNPPSLAEYLAAPKPHTSRYKRRIERAERVAAQVLAAHHL